jgi:hypothetical protein
MLNTRSLKQIKRRDGRKRGSIGLRKLSRIQTGIETAVSRLRTAADSNSVGDLRFTALATARELETLRFR